MNILEAVENNNIEKVKELLENGADVNVVGEFNDTALIIACRKRYTELAFILLNHGAKVKVVNIWGKSPLMFVEHSLDKSLITRIKAEQVKELERLEKSLNENFPNRLLDI